MEIKRKIYDRRLEWKELDNGNSALFIEGARRVGKSYIAEQFAKREYKSKRYNVPTIYKGLRKWLGTKFRS